MVVLAPLARVPMVVVVCAAVRGGVVVSTMRGAVLVLACAYTRVCVRL